MESDSDNSEYVPEEIEEKAEQGLGKVDLHQAELVFQELNQQSKPEVPKQSVGLEEAMKIARLVKTKQNEPAKQVTGQFAGETISFELGKRPKPSLDQVLSEAKKPKSLNTLSKSTIDWEKYKKTSSLEGSLEKNRKDGFIGKKNFLLETKEREKSQLSMLKRKKLN